MFHLALAAHGCRPNSFSEDLTGWQWATSLAAQSGVKVTVFTDEVNRSAIEEVETPDNLRFVYARGYADRKSWLPHHLAVTSEFVAYRRNARSQVAEVHRRDPIDGAQHVSYANLRTGTPLDVLPAEVPLIMGPVGGGHLMPVRGIRFVGTAAWTELLRDLHVVATRLHRPTRDLVRRADAVLVANRETARLADALGAERIIEMADTAMKELPIAANMTWSDDEGPLRVLWIGRLIPRKALGLALDAVRSGRRSAPIELTVAGHGPLRALEGDAPDGVRFVGQVPVEDLPGLYDEHDVVLFTSMRDSGCNPGPEALARSTPMVYVDHQGAALFGDPTWCVPVSFSPARTLASRLGAALAELALDRRKLRELRVGASVVTRHGTPAQRAAQVMELFRGRRD